MGVALASGDSVETARIRAKQAAAKVKPVIPQ
jgi:phosphoribosylglycinamide formyltransferase 2